jgi:hypothetical protein
MREEVAKEKGFQLYAQYGERQAAFFVGVEESWMDRHRKAGDIPFVRLSERKVRYFGYQIADIIIFGARKTWDGTERRRSG